ncbi:MAG: hypothetical protein DDT26_02160 [Dehalococcoidia bacterium]|nr:hypothetical protein [Chloroflexota bacterium]
MLNLKNTVLIVVDVQGKLFRLMHNKDLLLENLPNLVKGAWILEVPIIWTEQNPEKLGPTIPEVANLLSDIQPISKLSFSCCGSERFMQIFNSLNRKQILIAGIEAHICVYQTAIDLLNSGYEVQIVADATSSRTPENKEIGLNKARDAGATLTSTEIALFELLKVAEGAKFKEILKIVK